MSGTKRSLPEGEHCQQCDSEVDYCYDLDSTEREPYCWNCGEFVEVSD